MRDSIVSLYEVKSGSNHKVPKAIIEFEKRYKDEFLRVDKFVINRDILDFRNGVWFIPAFLL
jgi:hypothetical protein